MDSPVRVSASPSPAAVLGARERCAGRGLGRQHENQEAEYSYCGCAAASRRDTGVGVGFWGQWDRACEIQNGVLPVSEAPLKKSSGGSRGNDARLCLGFSGWAPWWF